MAALFLNQTGKIEVKCQTKWDLEYKKLMERGGWAYRLAIVHCADYSFFIHIVGIVPVNIILEYLTCKIQHLWTHFSSYANEKRCLIQLHPLMRKGAVKLLFTCDIKLCCILGTYLAFRKTCLRLITLQINILFFSKIRYTVLRWYSEGLFNRKI